MPIISSSNTPKSHHVKSKPLNLEKFLSVGFIIPGFTRPEKESKLTMIRFLIGLISLWIHAGRLFIWSQVFPDSRISMLLGDFTILFKKSKDYLCFMTIIWLISVFFASSSSLRFYFQSQGDWSEVLSGLPKEDLSSFSIRDRKTFIKLHKTLDALMILCKYLVMLSLLLITIFRFLPLINQPIEYIIAGAVWYPFDLIYTGVVSSWVALSGSLYVIQCYSYVVRLRQFEDFFHDKPLKETFAGLRAALLLYALIQHKIERANKFWKGSMGSLFIGMFLGYCFNLYQICFVQLSILFKVTLFFWGSSGVLICCILPTIFASHLRTYLRRLSRKLLVFSKGTNSVLFHLSIANTVLCLSSFKPFTVLGMFSYQWKLIPKMLAETAMNLMLLYAIKSR